jgi:hypothetical protein
MVPVAIDGDARLRNRSRARTPPLRYPEVAPGVPILRQVQDPYAASDATSVHDRGNMPTLLGLSKNPALALCLDTGPSLAGCLPTAHLPDGTLHSTVSRTAKLLCDRLGDGHDCSPASRDARAASKTHWAFLTRYALTARTKQFGLTFALPSQNFALMLASFNAASSRACLRRPRWATRDASSLHNVRTMNYAVAD